MNRIVRNWSEVEEAVEIIGKKLSEMNHFDDPEFDYVQEDLIELETALGTNELPDDPYSETYRWLVGEGDTVIEHYLIDYK